MKKIIFIISVFTIFLMVSKQSSAYGGWVECWESAGDPYQVTATYTASGTVHYSLFVDHGAAGIVASGQADSIVDTDGSTTIIEAFYNVPWGENNVTLVACHLNLPTGYAKVTAWW
ncbi:hypothetical protein GM418_01640 [Maribellus comscasis]|uniref:Uncharacterized protein n=1 Tax=Maribellus comscasis TaxID=2681766 RepID=A0A6I6JN49_9BACT|nr:hypothetical protein [Maribellus comscasis]QGY42400.1 hypothetical protein GM418_01640 [Maribellus comscasis]